MRHHGCVFRFDPLRPFNRLRSALSAPLLLLPLCLAGPAAMAQSAGKAPTSPASNEDLSLYRGITTSVFCNARSLKIDFPKAFSTAALTYTQILVAKHGGLIASTGNKKLTNKQLLNGAEVQVIAGAIQGCPDMVPADVKTKAEQAISKMKAAQ